MHQVWWHGLIAVAVVITWFAAFTGALVLAVKHGG